MRGKQEAGFTRIKRYAGDGHPVCECGHAKIRHYANPEYCDAGDPEKWSTNTSCLCKGYQPALVYVRPRTRQVQ